jgi:signal transduction histidine kinase/DNA-binding response OmpR family regulator
LCLFNIKQNKFQQFYENNLFSNNLIFKILEDDTGKLWVCTQKGITVFDPIKKKFKNYINQNGIQQGTFNINSGLKTITGEMYFGGIDGFNYFNPKSLFKNTNTPPLVITGLKINNKQTNPIDNSEITDHISMAKEINLSYKQNFSLDFIALNYTAPHENQYSYMLEGFDKEWNNVGNATTAVYTNLDPGTYTFKLRAQSEDGSWQTPEKAIKIIVNPPFWLTYFAYFLYLLILGLSLWAIRRRGIQKLRNEFALEQERREVKYLIERERREAERKMELEQLKIKFLTNLSHELKTPLTLILNPIENLLNNEKNVEKLEIINIVNRNAKRLLNLVNQLLDLRKIEENELKLSLTEEDIVSFSKEIFDSFKYISERKHISLDFESSITDYNTSFDKNKVERILINLLSNAIKFTNENGNVYCQIESDADRGIKLIIGDSGIGIPEAMQAKIFERFFQINNSTNILNQGSGIGLSIAQEFVKLHGGTITLESEENMGSIFTVYFPFVRTAIISSANNAFDVKPHKNCENEIKQKETEQAPIKKPVLLIVDDSEDLRAYLRESLKSAYKIIEASDGKQGWQKTLALHPEIIVSDINMPNMDGITLVKKIKNDIRTKHIPIILLTVLGEEIEQLKGLETGANDYLTKPFSLKLLNIKINNLLSLNHILKHTYSKQINLDVAEIEVVSEDEKFLLKIGRYIEEHITDPELSIEELSQKMYMSRGTLYSKILSLTGETPVEYVRSLKLKKAVALLEKSDMKISQIGYEVGFSNPNYFARAFKAKYGISPTEYINLKREPAKV